MYKRILVPVENSTYDEAIIAHVRELARENSSSVVLIHVADGWAARNIGPLHLRESEEMHEDLAYIEKVSASLESAGLDAEAVLASGDPADEIVAAAQREDLESSALQVCLIHARDLELACGRERGANNGGPAAHLLLPHTDALCMGPSRPVSCRRCACERSARNIRPAHARSGA